MVIGKKLGLVTLRVCSLPRKAAARRSGGESKQREKLATAKTVANPLVFFLYSSSTQNPMAVKNSDTVVYRERLEHLVAETSS